VARCHPAASTCLQCTNNAEFMQAQCRLACGVCCPEGDVLCERRRKRIKLGQQS
jgi:hypothetical protein